MTTATFAEVPFYYKNAKKYPYIDKISVGEDDHKTDFIYQFVKNNFFYQLDNRYTSNFNNITGPPRLITYSSRLNEVDPNSTDCEFLMRNGENMNTRFINIEFHEAVYPIRVCVYAINHLNELYRIWAQNSDDQWLLLWHNGIYAEYNRNTIELTCLQSYKFKTKMLRLEFEYGNTCKDYTKLCAVLLIGTSELILPKSPKQNLIDMLENIRYSDMMDAFYLRDNILNNMDIYYLQKNFRKYCIISKRNTGSFRQCELGYKQVSHSSKEEYNRCFSLKDESKCKEFKKDVQFSSDESKELSHSSFSMLPNEIILKILKNLNLKSLSCASRVNKRLNILSRDPMFYKTLNIRDTHFTYWRSDLHSKFHYFAPRCIYLSKLDVSFCLFGVSEFRTFLDTCGKHLTHLKLNYCPSINELAVCEISKICQNLKELDLSYCKKVTSKGLFYLTRLEFLERLHLQETGLGIEDTYTICNILQKSRHMRDLNIAGTFQISIDAVAIELKNSCPNLESINFSYAGLFITRQGIDALADCKNLLELNLEGIAYEKDRNDDSFYRLLSVCQRLENINLRHCHGFTDRDLRALMLCKNLKYLNLLGIDSVTPDTCSEILLKCLKLEKIILRLCFNINENLVDQWNEKYQHVLIIY